MARVHSGLVICLVGLTLVLLYLLDHSAAPTSVLGRARVLLGSMVVQGVIGYAQYFSHLPALLVGVHVFGATVVWMAMVWFYDGLTYRGAEIEARSTEPGAVSPTVPSSSAAAPVPR